MSIQQNINQLATVGAALYTQTPQYEKLKLKQEEKGLASQWKTLEVQEALLQGKEKTAQAILKGGEKPKDEPSKRLSESELKYYTEKLAPEMFSTGQRLNEIRARISPETSMEEIQKGLERGKGQFKQITKYDEQLRNLANRRAQRQQDARQMQINDMKQHMGITPDTETSLGKFGELNPAVQEAIKKEIK